MLPPPTTMQFAAMQECLVAQTNVDGSFNEDASRISQQDQCKPIILDNTNFDPNDWEPLPHSIPKKLLRNEPTFGAPLGAPPTCTDQFVFVPALDQRNRLSERKD